MVERLLVALRRLAAGTPARNEWVGDTRAQLDEIGQEFGDAWLLARQCPGLELTSAQRALLDEMDERLDLLIGSGVNSASTDAEQAEWARIVPLACQALVMLGEGGKRPGSNEFRESAPMRDDALPGVPHGIVRLSPWTPRWTTLFEEEAGRLAGALGRLALAVEHYGSTSVPGLPAKPILDILVGVRSPLDPTPYVAALESLGYEYVPWAGVPEHLVFGRDELRTHLVHVVEHGGSAWQRGLRFRDALRADPALAAAYAKLKMGLALDYPADRPSYTAAKTAFIESALAGS